jgi:hypothetical protein
MYLRSPLEFVFFRLCSCETHINKERKDVWYDKKTGAKDTRSIDSYAAPATTAYHQKEIATGGSGRTRRSRYQNDSAMGKR